MKIFLLSIALFSLYFELNARCIHDHHSNDCPAVRIFTESVKPKQIHYIYRGESCDCPKYHDVIVEEPLNEEKQKKIENYEFKINPPAVKPKEDEETYIRYQFDVHVEQPVANRAQNPAQSYRYKMQKAPEKQPSDSHTNSIRYIYDTIVEQPMKPKDEKQHQSLVAQIDTIVVPHPNPNGCRNPHHTPETCNCGCRDSSHTPSTCNCNKNVFGSSENEALKRIKRGSSTKKTAITDLILPKLKKIDPKELSKFLKQKIFKQKLPIAAKKSKISVDKKIRSKRWESSPCAYTFESCDLSKKTPKGCPLCYKCRCEPAEENNDQKFSPKNIRIPYRIVSSDKRLSAPLQQEFDYEPSAYIGLSSPDMYKHIEQIISKYPEHMAQNMPNYLEQQQDLLNFIHELMQNDKSPQEIKEDEDIRYKLLDNAIELYKMYESIIGKNPQTLSNEKLLNKRGTLIEIIEDDSNGGQRKNSSV